jgi:hypothetical protein
MPKKTRQAICAGIAAMAINFVDAPGAMAQLASASSCNGPYGMTQGAENQTVDPSLRESLNNSNVPNRQFVGAGADIVATQNATVQNVGGTVDLQSQAICNDADVSTDPSNVNVKSSQVCDATDPYARLNASVNNAGGDTTLSSVAEGNSFIEDTNAPNSNITNRQVNNSTVYAVVNSTVTNVNGNVTQSATAIGNNAQIVHY